MEKRSLCQTHLFYSYLEDHRKIIHIDMDAFYASVEQLDNPELKGKALAVGGDGERGVIAAASYEARKFGVKSAMASSLAKKKCPHLIFVPPRFDRYKEVSNAIRNVFYRYTDLVEPLALDEAFLDVTENITGHSSATAMAKDIRKDILEETGLTASAGISINKFTAKIASDMNKPNGQKTIKPHEVVPFLEQLPIHKFFGVGKVTAEKMKRMGIFNGAHLKAHSEAFLRTQFGKSAGHFYNIVRGVQHSPVKAHRERKSIGTERTLRENIHLQEDIEAMVSKLAKESFNRLERSQLFGKTITLKVKFSDFTQITRSKTLESTIQSEEEIYNEAHELFFKEPPKKSIRLMGISISNLLKNEEHKPPSPEQLLLDF